MITPNCRLNFLKTVFFIKNIEHHRVVIVSFFVI